MKNGATVECQDCEWSKQFDTEREEDEIVLVDGPECCPNCGSDALLVDGPELPVLDCGHEDFHADG